MSVCAFASLGTIFVISFIISVGLLAGGYAKYKNKNDDLVRGLCVVENIYIRQDSCKCNCRTMCTRKRDVKQKIKAQGRIIIDDIERYKKKGRYAKFGDTIFFGNIYSGNMVSLESQIGYGHTMINDNIVTNATSGDEDTPLLDLDLSEIRVAKRSRRRYGDNCWTHCETCACYDGFAIVTLMLNGKNYTKEIQVLSDDFSHQSASSFMDREYAVGKEVFCYYDENNPEDIRYEHHNTSRFLIPGIIFAVIAGLSLIGLIIISIMTFLA